MRIAKTTMDQFLPTDKGMNGTDVPDATVNGVEHIIIARLRAADFPVDTWVDPATTPDLIETVIAMWAAGVYYNTVFSEVDETGSNYGFRLQRRAEQLLDLIVTGVMELQEVDVATLTPRIAGGLVSEPAFTMGQIF